MTLNQNEQTFINMIQEICIGKASREKLLPSVLASLSILLSNWGTSKSFFKTKNIFKLAELDNWTGKVYDPSNGNIYDNKDEVQDTNKLIRVYDDYKDSINDFVDYILSAKRSVNGPLKYYPITDISSYKDAIEKMDRLGFITDYIKKQPEDNFAQKWIAFIEKYELYKWDIPEEKINIEEDIASKKKKKSIVVSSASEEEKEETVINTTIYRVRLNWENPSTQIFASENYDEAVKEALKHEGYKVYKNDDGELAIDPWDKKVLEETSDPILFTGIIYPIKGESITLNNCPVYRTALDKIPFSHMSGTFYFYDNSITNGKAKITIHKNIRLPDPKLILGYIIVR